MSAGSDVSMDCTVQPGRAGRGRLEGGDREMVVGAGTDWSPGGVEELSGEGAWPSGWGRPGDLGLSCLGGQARGKAEEPVSRLTCGK